jgi:hypothetical protein
VPDKKHPANYFTPGKLAVSCSDAISFLFVCIFLINLLHGSDGSISIHGDRGIDVPVHFVPNLRILFFSRQGVCVPCLHGCMQRNALGDKSF